MAAPPNIVLFVTDTTRVDDAYDDSVAPTLAALGDRGLRATNAFATAPWTLPSHASILTGTVPSKHGAHADHEFLDDALPTLPGLLSEAGYETQCVSNNTWLAAESGFERGFDDFHHMWQLLQSSTSLSELVDVTDEDRLHTVASTLFEGNPLVNTTNALYRLYRDHRGDDGAERTTRWIRDWVADRSAERPFFLLANYIEPHLDYRPPRRLAAAHLPEDIGYEEAIAVSQAPWGYLAGHVSMSDRDFRALRGLYRAEIAHIDEQIAAVRAALADAGELENTVFVVVADHGENLGDHGLMDHQYCLYDSLVHVPLVISGGAFEGWGDLHEFVSLADIVPTLLDAAGVEAPDARAGFQGRSIHPTADADPRAFVVSEYRGPVPSIDALEHHVGDLPASVYDLDRSLRAIRTAEYKLVRGSDGTTELYDVATDPDEQRDVAASNPRVVRRLERRLDDWLSAFDHADPDGSVAIGGQRKARLEQLGYLQ
ncbi:sulfatase [Halococcoides cellulosivorans]|uniref:Sulfatase n=1 Tax=Halococcoides cellulosivorans TaxID=1679096 RepID=A0A2R4X3E9_9EURY|nr:sulfatase [Halococcoides cellulosivorans]AWB28329.1 sulfatase [Halococcoides cellulosivorans]